MGAHASSTSATVSDSVFEGVKEKKSKSPPNKQQMDHTDVSAYVAKHAAKGKGKGKGGDGSGDDDDGGGGGGDGDLF